MLLCLVLNIIYDFVLYDWFKVPMKGTDKRFETQSIFVQIYQKNSF